MDPVLIKAIKLALYFKWRYEECNPEVGFGSSKESLLQGIEKYLGVKVEGKERMEVLAYCK